ncbi:unnamed protein product [Schistosoma bovis]|nr:unnamed protein product [Schistosoma bovis]
MRQLLRWKVICIVISAGIIIQGGYLTSQKATKLCNEFITLKEMEYMSDVNSTAKVETAVSCLPLELQNKWVEVADKIMMTGREPSFEEFVIFVEERARISRTRFGRLVHCNSKFCESDYEGQVGKRSHFNVVKRESNNSLEALGCEICLGDHKETDCMKLLKMNVTERRRGLCYLCLRKDHVAKSCNTDVKCDVDNWEIRYNSLLHIDGINNHVVNLVEDWNSSKVCLSIIPVRLYGPKRNLETCALLDSGSNSSLVYGELFN